MLPDARRADACRTAARVSPRSGGRTGHRQTKSLIHLVRQDCGSCHGLTLRGGLGPALTAARLKDWTPADLAATIIQGRPGTPMPPFKGILDEDEAHWIARQLLAGFPEGR